MPFALRHVTRANPMPPTTVSTFTIALAVPSMRLTMPRTALLSHAKVKTKTFPVSILRMAKL